VLELNRLPGPEPNQIRFFSSLQLSRDGTEIVSPYSPPQDGVDLTLGAAQLNIPFMTHVRYAAATIESGLCRTVLITHGEGGRSGIGRTRNVGTPTSLAGQFEHPYGPLRPPTLFTIALLRYMKTLWSLARAIDDGVDRTRELTPTILATHRPTRS
jgi:hypothetical protein